MPIVGALAPAIPRPKQALKELEHERGDILSLEQPLDGYYRLRIGKFRLIFRYSNAGIIEAIFLEERSMVYEVFEAQLIARLKS